MFRGVIRESQEARNLGEQPGNGIRKGNRRKFPDARPLSEPYESGAAVALIVERYNQGLFERGPKKSARRVAQMVVEMNNSVSGSANHFTENPRIV